jgi:hypothetical protein
MQFLHNLAVRPQKSAKNSELNGVSPVYVEVLVFEIFRVIYTHTATIEMLAVYLYRHNAALHAY